MVDKERLFRNHLDSLARKRLDALHAVFAKHAVNMLTPFDEIFPDVVDDFDVKRLNLSSEALQNKYETWQRVRYQKARQDFETMLRENSFVDFWGRMKKKQLDEAAMAIKDEEEDEDEDVGAGGGGRASLADMAKQIDFGEVQSVLQVGIKSSLLELLRSCRSFIERLPIQNVRPCGGSARAVDQSESVARGYGLDCPLTVHRSRL